MRWRMILAAMLAWLDLASCYNADTAIERTYVSPSLAGGAGVVLLGGNVTGLAPGGVLHISNGADLLILRQNGQFTFPTPIAEGDAYSIYVAQQPIGQLCTIRAGQGQATAQIATAIVIKCQLFLKFAR